MSVSNASHEFRKQHNIHKSFSSNWPHRSYNNYYKHFYIEFQSLNHLASIYIVRNLCFIVCSCYESSKSSIISSEFMLNCFARNCPLSFYGYYCIAFSFKALLSIFTSWYFHSFSFILTIFAVHQTLVILHSFHCSQCIFLHHHRLYSFSTKKKMSFIRKQKPFRPFVAENIILNRPIIFSLDDF